MFNVIRSIAGLVCIMTYMPLNADQIDGEELIDPTRPIFLRANGVEETTDVLAMIRNVVPASFDLSFIRAGRTPIAVINSERVTIGEVIGGATVIAIDRASVTLDVNGNERRISLYDNEIKTPVAQ